jgi:predicted NUDIX family NTP pyrophosphohydrolase
MTSRAGKRSAGILAYRRGPAGLEVFLVHPGGPFWLRRDVGAWSIPKGEYQADESALEAAQRELLEETGQSVQGAFTQLEPLRQPGGKVVTAFAVEAAGLDPAKLRSNLFRLEWPPGSGTYREFPEVDRAAWFALPEARTRMLAGQRGLLDQLEARLGPAWGR